MTEVVWHKKTRGSDGLVCRATRCPLVFGDPFPRFGKPACASAAQETPCKYIIILAHIHHGIGNSLGTFQNPTFIETDPEFMGSDRLPDSERVWDCFPQDPPGPLAVRRPPLALDTPAPVSNAPAPAPSTSPPPVGGRGPARARHHKDRRDGGGGYCYEACSLERGRRWWKDVMMDGITVWAPFYV